MENLIDYMRHLNDLPYETIICNVCGDNWRRSPVPDIEGGLSVAIIKSVADGIRPIPEDIAIHLGVREWVIASPFKRLMCNGIFGRNRIKNDLKNIKSNDLLTLCYYAGMGSGLTGVCYNP